MQTHTHAYTHAHMGHVCTRARACTRVTHAHMRRRALVGAHMCMRTLKHVCTCVHTHARGLAARNTLQVQSYGRSLSEHVLNLICITRVCPQVGLHLSTPWQAHTGFPGVPHQVCSEATCTSQARVKIQVSQRTMCLPNDVFWQPVNPYYTQTSIEALE